MPYNMTVILSEMASFPVVIVNSQDTFVDVLSNHLGIEPTSQDVFTS